MRAKKDINNLDYMLKVIKDRNLTKRNLGESCQQVQERLREQEQREYWRGRCPSCKTFNEVLKADIKFESGFFGTPMGHYTKCLHCGYNDVPVKCVSFDVFGNEEEVL